jgi:hypothetical protein
VAQGRLRPPRPIGGLLDPRYLREGPHPSDPPVDRRSAVLSGPHEPVPSRMVRRHGGRPGTKSAVKIAPGILDQSERSGFDVGRSSEAIFLVVAAG